MPPKADKSEQFIIQDGEAAPILLSTLQSDNRYIPYCTGAPLEEFLTACFKANPNKKFVIVGGGDLYVSNVAAAVTSSDKKIKPHPERVRFNKGESLHPAATAGLQIDLQWLNDHRDIIINAAKAALGNDADKWNIEIIAPEIDRSKKTEVTVARKTFYKTENKDVNATFTIDFYTWTEKPGLTPAEKSIRLANAFAYYDEGRRNFQSNYSKDTIKSAPPSDFKSTKPEANSSEIWNEFEAHHLNLFTLPDFKNTDDDKNSYRKSDQANPNKNKDLQFLCLKHGIDYQQFQQDLIQAKKNEINPIQAKAVFENATMAAFSHFSKHDNGQVARNFKLPAIHKNKGAQDDHKKTQEDKNALLKEDFSVFINELFLPNVQVILTEAAFLQTELYPKDKNDHVLQNIQKIGQALGHSIEFKAEYKCIESPSSSLIHNHSEAAISTEITTANRRDSGGSSGSKNTIEVNHVNTAPSTAQTAKDQNSASVSLPITTAEDLADKLTKHTNIIIGLICSPAGRYNVHLAMDFLNVVLGWYVYTLGTIVVANLEQDRYKNRDEKLWLNIQSIVNRMLMQLKGKESDTTYDIEYLANLSSLAKTYLTSTNVDCNDEENFSLQKTFLSRNTLNAWKEKVLEVQKFVSKASPGTATKPEVSQLESYKVARRDAQRTFTSLAVASNNGLETLQELRNSTLKFSQTLVGEETNPASLNDQPAQDIREPNYLKL